MALNNQIDALFKKSGISVPPDVNLVFSIDPNDYRISVSGVDGSLKDKIEEVLNEGGNAKALYNHILLSESNYRKTSTQITDDGRSKYSLAKVIKEYTGYDMRDMTVMNGAFITPDNRDLLTLFGKAYREANPPHLMCQDHVSYLIRDVSKRLSELAKNGYDSVPDMVLQISWKNGLLHDMHQQEQWSVQEPLRNNLNITA